MKNVHDVCRKAREIAQLCVGLLLVFFVFACAGERRLVDISDTSRPGIELGDEITLVSEATERVVAHMTQDGRVHVIAITKAGDALHVVVSEKGIEEKNKVGNDRHGYYENLAITSDAMDRVHLALKDKYWIWDKGGWHLSGSNRCALMARTGDAVACVTEAAGKELGTAAQWGIASFGGGPAGIPVPYRIRPAKIVLGVATEDGWSYRNVFDYYLKYSANLDSVGEAVLSGDAAGRLHLFFQVFENSYFFFRYASLALSEDVPRDIEWRPREGPAEKLMNSESQAIFIGEWFIPASPPLPFAVDPQTGWALFFARRSTTFANWVDAGIEIQGKRLDQPAEFPVPTSRPIRAAPAGNNRFHALLGVDHSLIYAAYGSGEWSAVTKIGVYGTLSLFLIDNASIQLASDGRRQVLAMWPRSEGRLVGRWVRLGNEE